MKRVYFLRRTDDTGPIKIGVSDYPADRARQIGFQLRGSFKVIAECPGTFVDEHNLHIKLSDHRATIEGTDLEYAQAVGSTGAPAKPLDRIGLCADEAERCAHLVEDFIGRIRGHGDSKANGPMPVPSGHLGQLDRLTGALDRLDKLARELGTIG